MSSPGTLTHSWRGRWRCYFNLTLRELKTSIRRLKKKKEWVPKKFSAGAESGVQVCTSIFVLEDVRAQTHAANEWSLPSLVRLYPSSRLLPLPSYLLLADTFQPGSRLKKKTSRAPLTTLSFTSELSFQLLIGYSLRMTFSGAGRLFFFFFSCFTARAVICYTVTLRALVFRVLRESSAECRGWKWKGKLHM